MLNEIDTFLFVTSIKDLLIRGRGKNGNVIITGPANCARTFMLKPVKLIFSESTFENPANDKYAWVEPEKAKVFGAIAFSYPPFFIDDSGAEFHAD